MSNVVKFLDELGRNPDLSAEEYAQAVAAVPVGSDLKQALLDRDVSRINAILGQPCTLLSFLVPAEEEQPDEEKEEDSPDDKESEARAA